MNTLHVGDSWGIVFRDYCLIECDWDSSKDSHLDRHATCIERDLTLYSDVCISLIWSWKLPSISPSLASILIDFASRLKQKQICLNDPSLRNTTLQDPQVANRKNIWCVAKVLFPQIKHNHLQNPTWIWCSENDDTTKIIMKNYKLSQPDLRQSRELGFQHGSSISFKHQSAGKKPM